MRGQERIPYLVLGNLSLLQDLLYDLLNLVCSELALHGCVGGCVEDALGALAVFDLLAAWSKNEREAVHLPMRHKHLKRVDNVHHGDGLIVLPLLYGLDIVDVDDVVVVGALVVDLDFGVGSARHDDLWWVGVCMCVVLRVVVMWEVEG